MRVLLKTDAGMLVMIIVLVGMAFSPQAKAADILLLTEIAVIPTEGEFIEIYNPNSSAVDLSDVYLY